MNRRHELHPLTAVINQRQKVESKRHREQALDWLAKQFPAAFDNTLQIRPLKIGIMDDLLQFHEQAAQAGISRSKLRQAVVVFTRRLDYLTCIKAQETRIDLHGNPVCPVTEAEALQAAHKIQKHVAKRIRLSQDTAAAQEPMPIHREQPAITIKRKITRSYDPLAVSRLKEKLGLT